jgi:hypothetical protein
VGVDRFLFVHNELQIDFGLYVDDIEASTDDEQLQWLRDRFEERYEIKWLVSIAKTILNPSEKSKIFVGIRTEIDHAGIGQQNRHAGSNSTDSKSQLWLGPASKAFFAAGAQNEPFPKLEAGANVEAKFHKRFRSKTAFLAHVAVQTRPGVLEHTVTAARRLNDPVPECEKYVD